MGTITWFRRAGPALPPIIRTSESYSARLVSTREPLMTMIHPLNRMSIDILGILDTLCEPSSRLQIQDGEHSAPSGQFQARSFFIDERGRFRIWARDVGAHHNHNDRSSLDHRLRDAPHVHSALLEVLQNLERFLTEGL